MEIKKHLEIALNNYEQFFGEPLIQLKDSLDIIRDVWDANIVLVSHGTEPDPVFNYANRLALELFEMDFETFIQMSSKKSAEPVSREERQRLLDEVSEHGCISDYTGIRVSSSGKRFYINNARVWNIYDRNHSFLGQAAAFNSWNFLK